MAAERTPQETGLGAVPIGGRKIEGPGRKYARRESVISQRRGLKDGPSADIIDFNEALAQRKPTQDGPESIRDEIIRNTNAEFARIKLGQALEEVFPASGLKTNRPDSQTNAKPSTEDFRREPYPEGTVFAPNTKPAETESKTSEKDRREQNRIAEWAERQFKRVGKYAGPVVATTFLVGCAGGAADNKAVATPDSPAIVQTQAAAAKPDVSQIPPTAAKAAEPTPAAKNETPAKKEEDDPANHIPYWANKGGVEMGTSISNQNISTLPDLATMKTKEFTSGSLADDISWKNVEKQPGVIDYGLADKTVDYLIAHGMKINGHSLIYSQDVPDWVTKGVREGKISRDQLIDITKARVRDTITHFKGRISSWVILSEFQYLNNSSSDVLRSTIGPELAEILFKEARDTDPDIELIYMDIENETRSGAGYARTKAVVDKLNQPYKGRPLVDTVGLEMHLDGANPPSADELLATWKSYGRPIRIKEMDVSLKYLPKDDLDRLKKQAEVYRMVTQLALDFGVKSIDFWTPGDKYSWLESQKTAKLYSPDADATMFDDNLKPKPALFAVLEVLKAWVNARQK